jgi:NhaP-type Na+/H+ or K+/H+ antiporter
MFRSRTFPYRVLTAERFFVRSLWPDPYIFVLILLGVAILAIAWVPILVRNPPLFSPIFCVSAGFLVFTWHGGGEKPLRLRYPEITERLSELIVIIALMGAGLKIDQSVGWRSWSTTWRLLAVAMPLTILGVAGMGWWVMGLAAAAALLLGAAPAPTDPVLASDVQLGPPGTPEEGEVRFALTSEAGLNDGLAFPFINLAIAMAMAGSVLGPRVPSNGSLTMWSGRWPPASSLGAALDTSWVRSSPACRIAFAWREATMGSSRSDARSCFMG